MFSKDLNIKCVDNTLKNKPGNLIYILVILVGKRDLE